MTNPSKSNHEPKRDSSKGLRLACAKGWYFIINLGQVWWLGQQLWEAACHGKSLGSTQGGVEILNWPIFHLLLTVLIRLYQSNVYPRGSSEKYIVWKGGATSCKKGGKVHHGGKHPRDFTETRGDVLVGIIGRHGVPTRNSATKEFDDPTRGI